MLEKVWKCKFFKLILQRRKRVDICAHVREIIFLSARDKFFSDEGKSVFVFSYKEKSFIINLKLSKQLCL